MSVRFPKASGLGAVGRPPQRLEVGVGEGTRDVRKDGGKTKAPPLRGVIPTIVLRMHFLILPGRLKLPGHSIVQKTLCVSCPSRGL